MQKISFITYLVLISSRFLPNAALVARPLKRRTKPSSSGKSSGAETLVIEKDRAMDPRDIRFTQNTVERSFSDGRQLLDVMLEMFHGKMKIEEIPQIRVASRPGVSGDEFYSVDNRRLLMFKILRIDEIHVTRILWTSEFDGKLRQNVPYDPITRVKLDQGGIKAFRNEVVRNIFETSSKETNEAGQFSRTGKPDRFCLINLSHLANVAVLYRSNYWLRLRIAL